MHLVGFPDLDSSDGVVVVVNIPVFGFVVESSVVVSLMNFCVFGTFSIASVPSTDITTFTFYFIGKYIYCVFNVTIYNIYICPNSWC